MEGRIGGRTMQEGHTSEEPGVTHVDPDHQSACMHTSHKYRALIRIANLLPHVLGQTLFFMVMVKTCASATCSGQ